MRNLIGALAVVALSSLAFAGPVQAVNPRFVCQGYEVTFCDYFQCCSEDCTQCRFYDSTGTLVYEGEPYCIDQGCIPRVP